MKLVSRDAYGALLAGLTVPCRFRRRGPSRSAPRITRQLNMLARLQAKKTHGLTPVRIMVAADASEPRR